MCYFCFQKLCIMCKRKKFNLFTAQTNVMLGLTEQYNCSLAGPLCLAILIRPLLLTPAATPPFTKRANTPRRIIQQIMAERSSWCWCCLSLCISVYKCCKNTHTNLLCFGQFLFPISTQMSYNKHGCYFCINNQQCVMMQRPIYAKADAPYRRSYRHESLLATPAAISNTISCQSSPILHLMAPDKHFTSRLRDTVSETTQQTFYCFYSDKIRHSPARICWNKTP